MCQSVSTGGGGRGPVSRCPRSLRPMVEGKTGHLKVMDKASVGMPSTEIPTGHLCRDATLRGGGHIQVPIQRSIWMHTNVLRAI